MARWLKTAVWTAAWALFLAHGPALMAQSTQSAQPRAQSKPVDASKWQGLFNQALDAFNKGDYARAEGGARDALSEATAKFGENSDKTAATINLLAAAFDRQGKYSDAEAQDRRALAIYEKTVGPNHQYTATSLNNLALVLEKQAKYADAELLLRRALDILQKTLGPNHPDTAKTLSNLARVLDAEGKYGETGLAKSQPPPAGAQPVADGEAARLAAQASVAAAQGNYGEAETLQQKVVAIHEKNPGPDSPVTATSLSNLASVLSLQGKFPDAEALYRRVLKIREKALGPGHPDTATAMGNLASTLVEEGKYGDPRLNAARAAGEIKGEDRYNDPETLYREAIAIQQKSLGADNPGTATAMSNLAVLYDGQGKFTDAEMLQRQVLAIRIKALGHDHPDTATTFTNLSIILDKEGKYSEAETLHRTSVEISRKAGNPRNLLLHTSRLGYSLARRGRLKDALPFYREALDTLDYLYAQTRGLSEETRQAFIGQYAPIYREMIKLLLQLHQQEPAGGYDREALSVSSRNQSRVFTELLRQADVAKFAGSSAFVALKTKRDQLVEHINQARQTRATIPVTQADAEKRQGELGQQISQAEKELADVEDSLWRDYPRFMELTNPRPVSADDLQKRLLRPGEVLLSYVLLPQQAVIFAVTGDKFQMAVVAAKRDDIARRIRSVRRPMELVAEGESVLALKQIDPAVLYSLYRDLVAPVAATMGGKQKVLVVGDGPLLTIPLEMLVTSFGAPEQNAFNVNRAAGDGSPGKPQLAEYAGLAYLGKQHRFAYLPSISALVSQRLYPKPPIKFEQQLVAFADPVFSQEAGAAQPVSDATRGRADGLTRGLRGASAGIVQIPRLKETADEAKDVAGVLGGASQLFLRADAQEHTAKSGVMKNARFVLFATHGFLAGDFLQLTALLDQTPAPGRAATRSPRTSSRADSAQPALALTLVGDLQGEDGFLTMKEVIEDLDLNAELVALSACNTAGESSEANNGEGFAGLTRAFMYAGAKSLLVSHWAVESQTTRALMIATFTNITQGKSALDAISSAEQTMLPQTFVSNNVNYSRGNPFFWAAFVYVGD